MDPKNLSRTQGADGRDLESKIQEDIIGELRKRGWTVRHLQASQAVYGWPDLFAFHKRYGARWIEIKRPHRQGDPFTPQQHSWFKELYAAGCGVWVLTGHSEEEINKLHAPCNWMRYLQAWPCRQNVALTAIKKRKPS